MSLFLILLPLSAKALPPPSPAGGNYLVLNEIKDHAVLDFETFGYFLPDGTTEFTFEAWVYPTTPPDNKNTSLTILHQQVRMLILNDEFRTINNRVKALNIESPKGDLILLMSAHLERFFGTTLSFPIPFVPNQWHHIAYESDEHQTITIINDPVKILQQRTHIGHDLLAQHPQDFVLGGFGKIIEMPLKDKWFYDSFTGYIDEGRISTEAR